MSLKNKLVDYLTDNAQPLNKIYEDFPNEVQSTIRGRLNANLNNCFKRIGKGIYLATEGDTKAVIIEGDAWEEIKNLEDNSIDCIITDSGYTCLNKHYSIGTTRKRNKEKYIGFETKDIDRELFEEMLRVLVPGGHFFSFLPTDAKDTLEYNNNFINVALETGFEFNKRAIWDKQVMGMGYNLRNRHEQIIFLSKGKRRKPIDLSITDVLSHKRIPSKKRIHIAQKPNELIEDLVKFSTLEGEVILDLFAGSLVLAEVGLKTKRNTISIEIDKKMIGKSINERHLKDKDLIIGGKK